MSSHEPLKAHRAVTLGSDRNFGLVFAGVFGFLGFLPLLRHGEPRYWALAAAAVFLVLSLAAPSRLAPLNRLWFRLGAAMHSVVSPVIMGLLFYCAVTPMGVFLRLLGKDLLRLRRSDADSYWIPREPAGPEPDSMNRQF